MEESIYKRYLGDSVYADFDGYSIILTTENGNGASNKIFLEPNVVQRLKDFEKALYESLNTYMEVTNE